MSKRFVIGAYEVDRVYGGPEEGGWWYDTGELVRTVAVEANEEEAYRKCRRANHLIRLIQRRMRKVSSVIYSGGRYSFDVQENALVPFYPAERPHYE